MVFRRRSRAESQPAADAIPPVAPLSWSDAPKLYARNWAFMTPELQQTLQQQTLFAAGVGGASQIIELACRTGFARFILADADHVELSNLNRQAFDQRHIGRNKAVALAELLRDIRPDVQVEVIPERITEQNYLPLLDRSSLVINSIDFEQPAFLRLNRVAQAAGKPVLLPLNLGWGGAVLVFTATSETLDEYLGFRSGQPGEADVAGLLVGRVLSSLPQGAPAYLAEPLRRFQERGANWPGDPQLGAGVYVTATLAVGVAVAMAAGLPVRVAPDVVHSDAWAAALAPGSGATPAATADVQQAKDSGPPVAMDGNLGDAVQSRE